LQLGNAGEVPSEEALDDFVAKVADSSAVSAAIDNACQTSKWWGSYVNKEEQTDIYTQSKTLAILDQKILPAHFQALISSLNLNGRSLMASRVTFWLLDHCLI
jgi:hypothetical protein